MISGLIKLINMRYTVYSINRQLCLHFSFFISQFNAMVMLVVIFFKPKINWSKKNEKLSLKLLGIQRRLNVIDWLLQHIMPHAVCIYESCMQRV